MQIDCPKCSKTNTLNLDKKVVCGDCKEELAGYKYRKYSNSIIATTSAVIFGFVGARTIDRHFLEDNRYPLAVEYSLVEACVSNYKKPVSYSVIEGKREICVCALQQTMEEISYNTYKKETNNFLIAFGNNAIQCK